jgi:hypothetical protein
MQPGGGVFDLGGHSIIGSGTGVVGIAVSSDLATIRNGSILGFGTGIMFVGGRNNTFAKLRVEKNGVGMWALGSPVAHFNTFRENVISSNIGTGLFFEADNFDFQVLRNKIQNNGGDGVVAVFQVDAALYQDNVVSNNRGYGFNINYSTSTLIGNTANNNGLDGIFIHDFPGFFPLGYRLGMNVANGNRRLGMFANEPVTDLGGMLRRTTATRVSASTSSALESAARWL